ncbi:unnamed protein product [Microthlaspi erraticum]|uniref:Uncharacterized protein n=1 Tax=Microthlaspi erraticum TaxID=1685480 RepID=A0A6D2KBW8_9BRAS|nr:unnamed protein product [Microthlaspi erraticum]
MGLVNQRNFNFFQFNNIVNRYQQISPSKRLPLVILHKRRVHGGPATYRNRGLYWLYTAVSCKCLSVLRENELKLHMLPPYSVVNRSLKMEHGTWHVPMSVEDDASHKKFCVGFP